MVFKIKTSEKTMEIFDSFAKSEFLQPFALSKLAIALSIKSGFKYSGLEEFDNQGLELNRQTITGEYDLVFKGLIEMNEGKHLKDEEYFPNYLKAYIDNGAFLLEQEYKYASTDFYTHLLELEKAI